MGHNINAACEKIAYHMQIICYYLRHEIKAVEGQTSIKVVIAHLQIEADYDIFNKYPWTGMPERGHMGRQVPLLPFMKGKGANMPSAICKKLHKKKIIKPF